jgi:PKD repeat protein
MKTLLLLLFLLPTQFMLAQWEPDVRLTNDPFSSFNYGQYIASSGDTVHVVWYDDRDGNYEIYYKRSLDGGSTWGEDIRLTNRPYSSKNAAIALSGSVVHVQWNDDSDGNTEVYYKRSTDGGNSWGEDTRITYTPGLSSSASISVSGSNVHLSYHDNSDGNWEIYYKRSTDGGLTWDPDIRLTDDPSTSLNPTICATGPVLHVVWDDYRDGNKEIYYKRSTDNGQSWGEDIRLTNNAYHSWVAWVCASGSDVYVVWDDDRDDNHEIYFKRSTDEGLTWGADTRLTNNDGESQFPKLAVSGTGLFVVWVDDSDGNQEIYYKHSPDKGITWEPDERLTNNNNVSNYPFLAISDCSVHVIWYDFRDGNYEIYYKRNPTGWDILTADFIVNHNVICPEDVVQFTDFTSCHPTQWQWTFPGGTPGTSNQQNPQVVYNTTGIYDVTLYVSHGDLNDEITKTDYITVLPQTLSIPGTPTGPDDLCQNPPNSLYNTSGSPGATDYLWQLSPADAGVAAGLGTIVIINWTDDFIGDALLMVKALNICTESDYSSPLPISVSPSPTAYMVTGGPYCIGTSGSTIELSGSQSNHTYELYLDDQPTGNTMQGNGSIINFPEITTPGTYTMMATENSTLCSNMMEGAVEVFVIYVPENPPKPQGPDYVDLFFNTETEYTTEGSSGSASYEWSLNPSDAGTIIIPEITSALVTWNLDFLGITDLSVRGVNECGPGSWSEALVITVDNTVGLSKTENILSVSVSPNPNNGTFMLSLQSKKKEILTLRVLNTLGIAIFEEKNMTLSENFDKRIELTGAPDGIYFLQIGNESAVWMYKIIIQKD